MRLTHPRRPAGGTGIPAASMMPRNSASFGRYPRLIARELTYTMARSIYASVAISLPYMVPFSLLLGSGSQATSSHGVCTTVGRVARPL